MVHFKCYKPTESFKLNFFDEKIDKIYHIRCKIFIYVCKEYKYIIVAEDKIKILLPLLKIISRAIYISSKYIIFQINLNYNTLINMIILGTKLKWIKEYEHSQNT